MQNTIAPRPRSMRRFLLTAALLLTLIVLVYAILCVSAGEDPCR